MNHELHFANPRLHQGSIAHTRTNRQPDTAGSAARFDYNSAVFDTEDGPDRALALHFCGLTFASPIVLLSGCVGFGEEYTRIAGFSNRHAGAIVLKGTTEKPR